MKKSKNITIEDARIGFRNFAGKEGKFNPAGKRTFCVFLEEDDAERLHSLGWNVKYLQPRDEGEKEQGYLQVEASYANYPPNIMMITTCGQNELNEDSIAILDWAEIETVDLTLNPYDYEFNGRVGIKAYLKSMYVTIVEDELEKKYKNNPDSADNSMCADCGSINGSCADCDRKCHDD